MGSNLVPGDELATFDEVKEVLKGSDDIVFFGGAGVSTASGIPDFRSENGLYNQKSDRPYPPEYYFSHEFTQEDPDGFADFCRECYRSYQVEPSGAHQVLAQLEKEGRLRALVTQNIDGLHQRAGSKHVLEVHGNMRDYYCPSCGRKVPAEDFLAGHGRYPCPHCGGNVRPDVVLYGEALDQGTLFEAVQAIRNCQTLIVGGSSLVVYPAAGLVDFYNGNELILINYEPTPQDRRADYALHGDISKVLPALFDY